MAFDESIVQKISEFLLKRGVDFYGKKMFSGVCFMVDDKMCCGTHIDKKTGESVLLCRIGEERYHEALESNDVLPMNFTGKVMKGYIYVTENGIKDKSKLEYWLQLCLDFNPLAQRSKKQKDS